MVKMQSPVTVGTTATRLVHSDNNRTALSIFNNGSTLNIYIGTDNGVTTSNGFRINPQTGITFNKGLGDRPDLELWAITTSSTVDVRIFEAYAEGVF